MSIRRVLHLVSPSAPGCGEAMTRLIGFTRRLLPEFEHEVLLIGPASASRSAIASQLGAHRRFAPIAGAPGASARGIRRALEARGADLIHAWDAASCGIVIESRPREAVAATLAAHPPCSGTRPLAQDRAEALCLGERARRQAITAGWLHARVRTVAPPATSEMEAPIEPLDVRTRWRRRWGFDDGTIAVGVVGDPWSAIDGKLAFDMGGRAWLAGHRVRLVIDPRVVAASELRRWADLTSLRQVFIEEPAAARPWEIMPGLDAVLLPESQPRPIPSRQSPVSAPRGVPSGGLSAQWALDAGVVVFVTRSGPLESAADPTRLIMVEPRANAGARALVALASVTSASLRRDMPPPSGDRTAAHWATEIRALYGRAAVSAGRAPARASTAMAASR